MGHFFMPVDNASEDLPRDDHNTDMTAVDNTSGEPGRSRRAACS